MAPPSPLRTILVLTAASLSVALAATNNASGNASGTAGKGKGATLIGSRQGVFEDNFAPSPGFVTVPPKDDGQSGGAFNDVPADCTCVAYYLCDDNQNINQDGQGVIDIRQQTGVCEHYLDYCCKFVNNGSNSNNTPRPDQSTERPFPPDNPVQPVPTPGPVVPNPNPNPVPFPSGPDPTPFPVGPPPRPRPGPDVHPTPPPQEGNFCGQRNPNGIDFRITGDSDGEAEFGEFPWMTAILQEERVDGQTKPVNVYQCGGALIAPQVVLTGAHCVANKPPSALKIRAGEWDTQTTKEKYVHQDRGVAQVIVHPAFNPRSLHNDIALLILLDPVQIGGHIGLVCLPEQDQSFDNHRDCFASGWGKDKFAQDGQYQVIMKKLQLPIVPNPECQELLRKTRLGAYFLLDASFICAGGEAGRDTCKGDGGSPLVCPIDSQSNRYYQAGIVAWGIDCGLNRTPGVYGSVARFRNWIDNELRQLNIDTSGYRV